MANSDLRGEKYKLPADLLKTLGEFLNSYKGDKHTEGYTRLTNIVKLGQLSYENMKNIKHILEKNKGDETLYNLNGGSPLESWINSTLSAKRGRIESSKKARKESGETNSYIRTHEKHSENSTKIRVPQLAKSMSLNDFSQNNVNYENFSKRGIIITEGQYKRVFRKLSLNENWDSDEIEKLKKLIASGTIDNIELAKEMLSPEMFAQIVEQEYGEMLDFAVIKGRDISSVSKLLNLVHLVSYNYDKQKMPETIGKFKKLQSINIFDSKIQIIPSSISELQNLQKLYIRNSQIETVPESIGDLRNLIALTIIDSRLKYLPESIGNLTNLDKLRLSGNQLTILPDSIKNLANLSLLSIGYNQIPISEKSGIEEMLPNCEINF